MQPLSTDRSIDSHVINRTTRGNWLTRKPTVCHFTLNFDEWQKFYHHKTARVETDWANQLSSFITRAGITCCIVFKRHYERKKNSRKKNCNLFSCHGSCNFRSCSIKLLISVEKEPKKDAPAIFTVYKFGELDHSRQHKPVSRPLTGGERLAIGLILLKSFQKLF